MVIAAIWLAIHPSETDSLKAKVNFEGNFLISKLNSFFPFLLTFSLAVHFGAGIHRTAYDFYTPYSASKATASYIEKKGWSEATIFGTRDVEVSTVAGYLDKDFYYPEIQGYGSYAQWNKRNSLSREDTLEQLELLFAKDEDLDKVLLVLSKGSSIKALQPGQELLTGSLKITADEKFERSWTYPEKFYLYWAQRVK